MPREVARRGRTRARPTVVSVADEMREAIVSGTFQPNERLVEERIADMFVTNRATVRLAMARLEQEALIVRERNRGVRVRLVGEGEALEILEARAALEALVAAHAARNLTPPAAERLEAMLRDLERHYAAGDLVAYSDLNAELHRTIAEISGHRTAAHLLSLLKSQVVRFQYRALFQPGRIAHSLDEHRRLVAAIVARDPAAAEAAMRDHLGCAVAALQRSLAAGDRTAQPVVR